MKQPPPQQRGFAGAHMISSGHRLDKLLGKNEQEEATATVEEPAAAVERQGPDEDLVRPKAAAASRSPSS